MKCTATLRFVDRETQDEGVAVVRYDDNAVALALSLRLKADMEVFLSPEEAKALGEAHASASKMARSAGRAI